MTRAGFGISDIALKNKHTHTHTSTHKCHCHILLLEVPFNCGSNTSVDTICHTTYVLTRYITIFQIIDYLKHCISYTAVHKNVRDIIQQDGVVNKRFGVHRIVCVCVCVPTTKHGNFVLEKGLREIFVLKREGVTGG